MSQHEHEQANQLSQTKYKAEHDLMSACKLLHSNSWGFAAQLSVFSISVLPAIRLLLRMAFLCIRTAEQSERPKLT